MPRCFLGGPGEDFHVPTQTACLYTHIALVAFLTTIWHGWAIAWWAPASTPLALSGSCPSSLWIDPHLILLTGKQWKEKHGLSAA